MGRPTISDPKRFSRLVLKQLDDQAVQMWRNRIGCSSRFKLLADLRGDNYSRSQYLDIIMDIYARNVLTRLRLDMPYVESCQERRKGMSTDPRICPVCKDSPETVTHFQSNVQGMAGKEQDSKQILLTSCHTSIILAPLTKHKYFWI